VSHTHFRLLLLWFVLHMMLRPLLE